MFASIFFLHSILSERTELESRVELLVTKEREWIEWNAAAEQMVARVAVIVDAWIASSLSSASASSSVNSSDQASGEANGTSGGGLVELLERCERAHLPLCKRLDSAAAALAAHRHLEDALRNAGACAWGMPRERGICSADMARQSS